MIQVHKQMDWILQELVPHVQQVRTVSMVVSPEIALPVISATVEAIHLLLLEPPQLVNPVLSEIIVEQLLSQRLHALQVQPEH